MEAKDLRIGNYIFDPFDNVVDVIGINLDSIKLSNGNGGTIYSFSAIPLTEEWLIKFGFTKVGPSTYGNKYTISIADWGFTIENSFEKEKWFFGHEYYDSGDEDENYKSLHFCFDMKYVHQLQNIYQALTFQELKLK